MAKTLKPVPDGKVRAEMARRVRHEAADVAYNRAPPPLQVNNGAASGFHPALYTFTKGLKHDEFGCAEKGDLETLIEQINQDQPGSAPGETPLPGTYTSGCPAPFDIPLAPGARTPESPLAGHTLEINGPDADALAMPPAPDLGSAELTAEMAEVYGMALIRDVPFSQWSDPKVSAVISCLNKLPFFKSAHGLDRRAKIRRAARFPTGAGMLNATNLFRGSTPGSMAGDYLSVFMHTGNNHNPTAPDGALKGLIRYGAQTSNQKFVPQKTGDDYMTDLSGFLAVQDGAPLGGQDSFDPHARFMTTPRDLTTYVHFDALYQAYLNACLVLLAQRMWGDIGLPEGGFDRNKPGSGHPTRDGFALNGGPHVLTLVTEVATRALKAVRRQKFNIHLRARPEALAGALTLAWGAMEHSDPSQRQVLKHKLGNTFEPLCRMVMELNGCGILDLIKDHNHHQNVAHGRMPGDRWLEAGFNGFLPMAFPEGSPMHPAYGAGHATVAGACVTILKAFFEMFEVHDSAAFKGGHVRRGKLDLKAILKNPDRCPVELFGRELTLSHAGLESVTPDTGATPMGSTLDVTGMGGTLTIQGELDKLAANISIGRDFAGVHYYTDYYESLRLGERIAVGLLQEQMLTYREPVAMRFTSFDGDRVMIAGTGGSRGGDDTPVLVWSDDAGSWEATDFVTWWHRGAEGLVH